MPYWTRRRILLLTYKIFMSSLCLLIALTFAMFGQRIFRWLSKVERTTKRNEPQAQSTEKTPRLRSSHKILFSTLFSVVSLTLTSIFLLLLVVTSWRNVYFGVIFLWVVEVVPLTLLVFMTRQQKRRTPSSSVESSFTDSSSSRHNLQMDVIAQEPGAAAPAAAKKPKEDFNFMSWGEDDLAEAEQNNARDEESSLHSEYGVPEIVDPLSDTPVPRKHTSRQIL